MKILVSGGAGFIGSHLCDALLADGHSVVCADKLIMGDSNIAHLNNHEYFTFMNTELAEQDKVDELFSTYYFDAVYHLAANSDIQKGGKEPELNFTGGDRGWKGDVPRFSYDISKVLSTGWKPQYTSDEAVRQSVRDVLNQL